MAKVANLTTPTPRGLHLVHPFFFYPMCCCDLGSFLLSGLDKSWESLSHSVDWDPVQSNGLDLNL